MIKKLKMENIQSHKKTEIEFDPGLNVIIGSSDSGKSSIIRALYWIVKNEPRGDSIRSDWGGDSIAEIVIDGVTITRKRTNKVNQYLLNGNPLDFDSMKRVGVPDEISTFLNLDDVNFHHQLEKPYLLDESSGEVARHFNRIAHIEIIHESSRKIESWIKSINHSLYSKEQDINEFSEELKAYEYLPELEGLIISLEQMDKKLKSLNKKKIEISKLVSSITKINAEIEANKFKLELGLKVDSVLEMINTKENLIKTRNNLRNLLDNIQDTHAELEDYKSYLVLQEPIDTCIELMDKKAAKEQDKVKLLNLISDIEDLQSDIKDLNKSLKVMETEFKNNLPTICPILGIKCEALIEAKGAKV